MSAPQGEAYLRKRFSERIWDSPLIDEDADSDEQEALVSDLVEGLLIEMGF